MASIHATNEQRKEAEEFLQECHRNFHLNVEHECDCFAVSFLKKRIELGPLSQIKVLYWPTSATHAEPQPKRQKKNIIVACQYLCKFSLIMSIKRNIVSVTHVNGLKILRITQAHEAIQ